MSSWWCRVLPCISRERDWVFASRLWWSQDARFSPSILCCVVSWLYCYPICLWSHAHWKSARRFWKPSTHYNKRDNKYLVSIRHNTDSSLGQCHTDWPKIALCRGLRYWQILRLVYVFLNAILVQRQIHSESSLYSAKLIGRAAQDLLFWSRGSSYTSLSGKFSRTLDIII